MTNLDYKKFLRDNWLVNFPLIGKRMKLGLKFGIHDNTYLEKLLSKMAYICLTIYQMTV